MSFIGGGSATCSRDACSVMVEGGFQGRGDRLTIERGERCGAILAGEDAVPRALEGAA